ncbi:DNA sulfur modification protein DndB [Mycolicibacterium fortuitum]|uniref:DNA sulfur modification protein DndB n=1 Tax=Mycolicibacterium fortuitum TaxID=1766 RepID=UPI00241DFDC8|nr:DNA sulfur modification protein DndB [Mycolicibacterium fortuitum]MDG5771668.1 DNA sulfur modification protein DndB [Mycolicibacterium fortuitum]MDG5782569.1 DNA sulfur modification protein DndB [Mycolicibacterium fortuitum]
MSDIPLEQPTALNLILQGSAGRFQVGGSEATSLEVRYFLTNVGLALGQGANDHLLTELAPVREVFRTDELGFDELMQRDIDDARITSELIPYLLDDKSTGLVKLFPPIIVMVLPKAYGEDRPLRLYPSAYEYMTEKQGYTANTLRIGELGSELLTLEQPIIGDYLIDHDRVRLSLNTQATRLVIVDGQHRAMALLAIFRNLQDQWSDARKAPYRDFYAEWTPELIGDFQLDRVQLPMMICCVPELVEGTAQDFDLIKAARRVFLTLNKTARKVSASRNKLLDDADLIASFMRSSLEQVKGREHAAPSELRLWSVELDQTVERVRIQSPTALTGVTHIYYMVEHLMMATADIRGLRARPGRYAARTDLSSCLRRLEGRDLIGDEAAEAIRRDLYTSSDEQALVESFNSKYGSYILTMFDQFGPYAIHNAVVNELEFEFRDSDNRMHSLLFGSQGSLAVFTTHKDILMRREDNESVKELLARVTKIEKRLGVEVEKIRDQRALKLLRRAVPEGGDVESLTAAVTDLYRNYFSSIALQAAILCTFFGEVERANRGPGIAIAAESEFTRYLSQLSRFFAPTNKLGLEGLIRVFVGEIAPTDDDPWRVVPSENTFRRVVFSQEMQPDQWPKLRYLLLELWNPEDPALKAQIETETEDLRREVVKSLFSRYRASDASALGIPEDDLSPEQLHTAADRCVTAVGTLLVNLQAPREFDRQIALQWAEGPPVPDDSAEGDDEADDA